MLTADWNSRKTTYDFVIIGSGYGGAITAARLATANLNPKPSICILERGREWPAGSFPDKAEKFTEELKTDANPLGLYELLAYPDIAVIKGSGLGGTSLINANVAIVPDQEVFDTAGWPKGVDLATMMPYYKKASEVLAARPHPRAHDLLKVQALDRRAKQIGTRAEALNITVNFSIDGKNPHGVEQKPCTDCGDCVSGCNVSAKNTLYMNYLPMAAANGVEIHTQVRVDTVEKDPAGGYVVSGTRITRNGLKVDKEKFTLRAGNVVLAAGSINSTEILLRSAANKGLSVSPLVGSRFGGNGDFFGLSYNGNNLTQVLGFGNHPNGPGSNMPPGPTIVSIVRYNRNAPVGQRFAIEDLSFPKALFRGAQAAFAVVPGQDTDTGDEAQEFKRRLLDLSGADPYSPNGALNHTILYLCMGMDDAQGYFRFEKSLFNRNGKVSVHWPNVGAQPVFSLINEELKRHARSEGASFIENPIWSFLGAKRLITAHPLGGCPMGDDVLSGAVDQFGRVFSADGGVHDGLFVIDGAVVPTALAVNPFLTISATAERAVERKIQAMQGYDYEKAPLKISMANADPLDAIHRSETELERIFERTETMSIDVMVNKGTGKRDIDLAAGTISHDEFWKGFFPAGHVLNQASALVATAFRKRFFRQDGDYLGLTSDTDGNIRAKNELEVFEVKPGERKGDLTPGKYILLRYVEPQWSMFYDIFKVVNSRLLIGRVYLGPFPNGTRMFTFPMTRVYGLTELTAEDHRQLWADTKTVPTPAELQGTWRMDVLSNHSQMTGGAMLSFENQPDGRLEARYRLMGLLEGLVLPSFVGDHFQLNDFTLFHDEIRTLDDGRLIGKWITDVPFGGSLDSLPWSLGIFHREKSEDGTASFGFYYTLTRTSTSAKLPTTALLEPFLDQPLPRGLGMTFDETMEGSFFPGDLREGKFELPDPLPSNTVDCSFTVRMTINDLNEFIDGAEHEARLSGKIRFSQFAGIANAEFEVDRRTSFFNYLRVNPVTNEAEMRYYIEFQSNSGTRYSLSGTKFMQKDNAIGYRGTQELLDDYTTLYCRVAQLTDSGPVPLGSAYLKFRTFEDIAAVGNLAGFLATFRVTGTLDPFLQLRGQLRFLAFTGKFVQSEYDPLALPIAAGGN